MVFFSALTCTKVGVTKIDKYLRLSKNYDQKINLTYCLHPTLRIDVSASQLQVIIVHIILRQKHFYPLDESQIPVNLGTPCAIYRNTQDFTVQLDGQRATRANSSVREGSILLLLSLY